VVAAVVNLHRRLVNVRLESAVRIGLGGREAGRVSTQEREGAIATRADDARVRAAREALDETLLLRCAY
jgi:hypothetical protein